MHKFRHKTILRHSRPFFEIKLMKIVGQRSCFLNICIGLPTQMYLKYTLEIRASLFTTASLSELQRALEKARKQEKPDVTVIYMLSRKALRKLTISLTSIRYL